VVRGNLRYMPSPALEVTGRDHQGLSTFRAVSIMMKIAVVGA
jgi:hypothetical protein